MKTLLITLLVLASFIQTGFSRDAARDLRRLVGYKIVAADTVEKVIQGKIGEKYIQLKSGITFKVPLMILDPLPLADVIIFAKPPTEGATDADKNIPQDSSPYQIKILIDNEIYDALPAN